MAELRVLGKSEFLLNGNPVRFRSAKVIELLAFLATHPDRRASRAQVADALYPDSPRSRENLRQTLLYLAQSASGIVFAEGDSLSLTGIDSDLVRFQEGDYEAYGGAFLPTCSSDWAMAVRADLEQDFVSKLVAAGLETLATDPDRAAALAKRAIRTDPYLEHARRLRWQALERLDKRVLAAMERAQYAEFIREEIGIDLGNLDGGIRATAASLSPPERLLRAVALVPEAFERGRLAATGENLRIALDQVEAEHPYAPLGWIALARLLFEIGDTSGAEQAIRQGREMGLTLEQGFELGITEGRVQARLGNHDLAEHRARSVLLSKQPDLRTEGHLLLAYIAWARIDYPLSLEEARKAFHLAQEVGIEKLMAKALRSKAGAYFRMGQIQEAMSALEQGIEIAKKIGRVDLEAGQRGDLGRLHEVQGDLEAARTAFRQAMDALEQTDYRVFFAQSVTYLGDLEHRLKNFEEAGRYHAIGVATRRMMGDLLGLATSYRGLGKAQLGRREYSASVESFVLALRLFRRFSEAGSVGSVRVPLARALYGMGDVSEAKQQAQQAALDLNDISEEASLIRYNDPSLLPGAVAELIKSMID